MTSKVQEPAPLPAWFEHGWSAHPEYVSVAGRLNSVRNELATMENELSALSPRLQSLADRVAQLEVDGLVAGAEPSELESARQELRKSEERPQELRRLIDSRRRAVAALVRQAASAQRVAQREIIDLALPHCRKYFAELVEELERAAVANGRLTRLMGALGEARGSVGVWPWKDLEKRANFDPAPYTFLDRGNLSGLEFAMVQLRELDARIGEVEARRG